MCEYNSCHQQDTRRWWLADELTPSQSVLNKLKSTFQKKKGRATPVKPSDKEEEYFARQELERRKKMEEEKHGKLAEEEKKRLKELHYMRCPKCGMELTEIDYKRIRVDKCFGCEGVWLDAGEMEAISKLEQTALAKMFSVFK